MFKKKLNISDLLDKKDEQKLKIQVEFNKKYIENTKKIETVIETVVIEQFNIAKSVVGHRLTMERNHDRTCDFSFKGNLHRNSYIYFSDNADANMNFTFCCNNKFGYYEELKAIRNKEFKNSKLANILIKWVEIITKKELKEE